MTSRGKHASAKMRIAAQGARTVLRAGHDEGINAQHAPKLRRLLAALHTAAGPDNMNVPGYRLHQLKGDRSGQWAVWVSGNWRLVFAFDGDHATNVDQVDYH